MLTNELMAVAFTAMFTGILWIPIIVNRLREMGIWRALTNPEPDTRPAAQWAYRLACAHRNAIENLVVFAPLAIVVHVLAIGDSLTDQMCIVFVVSRVSHAVIYTAGVPLLRTIAFFLGFVAESIFALRIFGVL
ncbi:MAG: MAPEG family protein [Pseudomonadota bacterium]